MWDIVVPLILMIVFYLVPEILKKRRKPEEYKYPEIPDNVPPLPPDRLPPPIESRPAPRPVERPLPPPMPPRRTEPPADIVMPPRQEHKSPIPHMKPVEPTYTPHLKPVEPTYKDHLPPAVAVPAIAETAPWDGRLDPTTVMNGVIFAEILQPPRSRRPGRPWIIR
jgi:hypothetical protein